MELSLEVCTEICPHCGKVNVFPGFAKNDGLYLLGIRGISYTR